MTEVSVAELTEIDKLAMELKCVIWRIGAVGAIINKPEVTALERKAETDLRSFIDEARQFIAEKSDADRRAQ